MLDVILQKLQADNLEWGDTEEWLTHFLLSAHAILSHQ